MKRPRLAAHALLLSVVVFGTWLLLSGHYTPFLLTIGLVCTALVVYVSIRMELVDEEGVPIIHLSRHIWTYIPWLMLEVIRSNIAVTRIVLHPKLPISPTIVRFRGFQKTDVGRVAFANSITLTPGTVTIAVVGTELYVHGLYLEAIDGIEESEMNYRVAAIERAGVS